LHVVRALAGRGIHLLDLVHHAVEVVGQLDVLVAVIEHPRNDPGDNPRQHAHVELVVDVLHHCNFDEIADRAGPGSKTALDLSAAAVTGHQLWFRFGALDWAGVTADTPPQAVPPPRLRLVSRWTQPLLCDLARDMSGVSSLLPPLHPGLAMQLLADAALQGSWVPHDRATLGVLFYRGLELLRGTSADGTAAQARQLLKTAAQGYRATKMLDVVPVALGFLAEAERRLSLLHLCRCRRSSLC